MSPPPTGEGWLGSALVAGLGYRRSSHGERVRGI